MRVNVASFVGTHPLDLARELDKAGILSKYYTALPKFRVRDLDHTRVTSHALVLLPHFLMRRAGLQRFEPLIDWATTEAFDRWLCRAQDPCDVFHVLSSYGLRAIRRAKSLGALTVCDHGSSHIRIQDELLRDEFSRWGMRFKGVDPRFIAKEEAEYDEADLVFVPSTFARQSFIQAGVDRRKVVTLPYGVRLAEYFPAAKRDEVFRVLCVASLSVRKGIGYLLKATERLALPNSEVVLRGTVLPESKPVLANHEGRFRLQPPVPRKQLRDLYSQASVLVLPSIEDGFGLVIAQAMACGVPVIATTHTGGPDLITDGKDGFVVPVRSAEAIAERLEYLYRHPEERVAMGRAALEKVRSLNGWGHYADEVIRTYKKRLNHRHAP